MPPEAATTTAGATQTQERNVPETRETPFVSVVIPCLNEAQSIEESVLRARRALEENGF
jgi:hypothetical protein